MENGKEKKDKLKKRLYGFVLKLIKTLENTKYNQTTKVINNQLLRSSTSILANYVEGQSSYSRKEFTNFLSICLKSTNESKVWIALLKDTNYIEIKDAQDFLKELDEFSKIFASSILTLKQNKK
ncbi:four helix bundle protein [Candidatus Woesebacteria bacterium]|nr:four helix bundle protein [Candidatus Woesebacteria bacterium]